MIKRFHVYEIANILREQKKIAPQIAIPKGATLHEMKI